MKILNLRLGRYFDKQILKKNKFGLLQDEFRQKRKMLSGFTIKKNNGLKNWESEEKKCKQVLTALQCTCNYVTALYKGSSWFMKSTPEALPGIMSWPLKFYCNNKDTDKMQIPAMAKIHHQATLFILLVMFFFFAQWTVMFAQVPCLGKLTSIGVWYWPGELS